MRITIKSHNRAYIDKIATQMEISDKSEVINYLLLELKRLGYSFNSQISVYPLSQQPEDIQYSIPNDSLPTPSEAFDPIIERLISLGVCQEF